MSQSLPIQTILPELEEALSGHRQVILQAEPGAGKSTVVPLALLDKVWLKGRKIVMLEPRRLAARAAAERMAETLGEEVGQTVGYRMRGETKVSGATRIEVVTEGVLIRMLQSDPSLEGVGLVIFDEFHERSIHADLSLALTLQAQELFREELKILVMSATLQREALQNILPDAPYIYSEGRSYAVRIRYLDIKTPLPGARGIVEMAVGRVLEALSEEEGGILLFLPGEAEIRRAESLLGEWVGDEVIVTPLYGAMAARAQRRAIESAPQGKRKVVLATNIAETSLTIDGVRVVIDSGLERRVRYDANLGMERYETGYIGRDSATQRAGRAGRTAPGVCYRLWHETHALRAHREPEILSADLTPLALELALWGATPEELPLLDTPPAHAYESAVALLEALGMLESNGAVTAHGESAVGLGLHPRIAHMLLRAKGLGLAYEGALLAILWSERPLKNAPADIRERMEILHRRMEGTRRLSKVLGNLLGRLGAERGGSPDIETAGVLTALAYPERVARSREGSRGDYLAVSGTGLRLSETSPLAGTPYLAVAETGRNGTIHSAAPIAKERVEELFADRIECEESLSWSDEKERVEAVRVRRLGAVRLDESPIPNPDGALVAKAMLDAVRRKGLEILPWSESARTLLERARFVHTHLPEILPDMGDERLLETLESWLMPHLEGVRTLKELQRLDMLAILKSAIGWERMPQLERLAPERLEVPGGSRVLIDYGDTDNPVLASRLQELFGWQETPKILGGEVSLTIHLLSPAMRPLAVTKDLASFWREVYPEVRKEMRGRYPKHYWPEDPFNAEATRKTKKGMGR
jgi:ATP-dependent helicase HrpB